MQSIIKKVISKNTVRYSIGNKEVTVHLPTTLGTQATFSWSSASLTAHGYDTAEDTMSQARLLMFVVDQYGMIEI